MIIINAVECTKKYTIEHIVDNYLSSNPELIVYTDSTRLKKYVDSTYGENKCIHYESLVALWLRIVEDSILIITEMGNVCSEIYLDLSKNYTITAVEDSNSAEDVRVKEEEDWEVE